MLDTHHDRQNGFVFGTNPAGLEYDGQVANEGRGSGSGAGGGMQQGGSGGGFNLNWDGSWRVRTAVGPSGWSAEFEIPFRTLRYPAASLQTWGLNFERRIRRRNETAYWAPLPRQYDLFRVSMAGTLQGLEIPAQRNLKIMPYLLGQARDETLNASDPTLLGEPGIDLKYSVTPSLTLDATYRTDFAQVEDREASGRPASGPGHNRSFAVDGQWGIGQSHRHLRRLQRYAVSRRHPAARTGGPADDGPQPDRQGQPDVSICCDSTPRSACAPRSAHRQGDRRGGNADAPHAPVM